jgi:hypothetical protein
LPTLGIKGRFTVYGVGLEPMSALVNLTFDRAGAANGGSPPKVSNAAFWFNDREGLEAADQRSATIVEFDGGPSVGPGPLRTLVIVAAKVSSEPKRKYRLCTDSAQNVSELSRTGALRQSASWSFTTRYPNTVGLGQTAPVKMP